MKHRSELNPTTKQVKCFLLGLIACLGLLCLFYGSSFAPGSRRSDDEASGSDGSDPFIGGFARNRDFDDLHEDQEHNPEVPKSIPVSDALCSLLYIYVCVCSCLNLSRSIIVAKVNYEFYFTLFYF